MILFLGDITSSIEVRELANLNRNCSSNKKKPFENTY